MKNFGFIFLFFYYASAVYAQAIDNFSDGNFTQDPVWSGSSSHFTITASQQLQLNNSLAGMSYLSTLFAAPSLDNFEWQVYVKQVFSPSGSNYGRVYLVSDQADLSSPLNGYYLQFGEAGANDAVQLFQQTGLVSTSICRATNGAIATSFALRVKVQRDSSGFWKLSIDYSGGANFVQEATGTDQIYAKSSFLGVLCVYTSSNASKFYYDDFIAGPQQTDVTPPALESIDVLSPNSLSLHFSEPLDRASAESTIHYFVNNGIGNPLTIAPYSDGSIVDLFFSMNFPNGVQNQLMVSGLKDLAGNSMTTVQFPFMFFQPAPTQSKDIILTEIFADPVPQIGLPTIEFIEIYNRSENAIDLSGWKLSDGTSTAAFPSQIILPLQYWIITASAFAAQFDSFGNVIGMSNFLTLNNDRDALTLKNPEGLTIDSVNYSISWYDDPDKQDGGWSLELIDLHNPCGEEENWTASEDPAGGTPGKQNSVWASKPDLTGPLLLSVIPVHQNSLLLNFDEKLDASAPLNGLFVLSPTVPISTSYFTDRSLRQIRLGLSTALQLRQKYTLKVQNVRDCNENLIKEEFCQLDFALSEPADSLDVLTNEILFNPRPNGVDFVEIFNSSPKYINLRNWKLANIENNALKNIEEITSGDLVLAPDSYFVFTVDPILLKNNYPQGQERNFFATQMPGLPDDEGSIALVDDHGKVIDYFSYNKNFHSDLIKDDEGVSLERISFSSPTNDRQNWKSTSSQAGFATPGYINSNAHPENPVSLGNIIIEPEIFIPGAGMQDFAKINYAFDHAGYIANIKIIDQLGHLIKVIANNETLGSNGFFRWDGDHDDRTKSRMGYYVVWIEVFDGSGSVWTFRKRVVVASK